MDPIIRNDPFGKPRQNNRTYILQIVELITINYLNNDSHWFDIHTISVYINY